MPHLVKDIAIPSPLEIAENGRHQIAGSTPYEAGCIEVATHVVQTGRREVSQNGPHLKQARPFKCMVEMGHVGAQACRRADSNRGSQQRPLFVRLESGKRLVGDIAQGMATEQRIAHRPMPARGAAVYPPTRAKGIEHAQAFGQLNQGLPRMTAHRNRVKDLVQSHNIGAGRPDHVRQPANVQPTILASPSMNIVRHHPNRMIGRLT
jgi:hypothetical protein